MVGGQDGEHGKHGDPALKLVEVVTSIDREADRVPHQLHIVAETGVVGQKLKQNPHHATNNAAKVRISKSRKYRGMFEVHSQEK